MTLRFLVIPGWVTSKTDGDKHYIGVGQLVRLYQLRPGEWTDREGGSYGLKRLYPNHHGHYGHPDGD